MAKNDRFLLDGIIDDRVAMRVPSAERDEAFEYFAFEQILKEYDLSAEEILSGAIDGRGDGGIDGFFVLVNGHLLQDPESFVWPRTSADLRVKLITCKHGDSFKQAAIDSLVATLTEVLDFAARPEQLVGRYSERLLSMRKSLELAYRKLSPRLAAFSLEVYYVSRGSVALLGAEVEARGRHVEAIISACFGFCTARFNFVGAAELVELHRRVRADTLELPFVEALARGERYVLLVRLGDYYRFVSDAGTLRRYLFDSNVRDFMGLNRINEDIMATLGASDSPDFWLLNNGVTVLASAAAITGKTIQACEIQIVNGLQTTECIYRHFSRRPSGDDDRCLLVKVVVSKDAEVRDAVICATNNQTVVGMASLHATDRIQRDIEEALLRSGLFYERRINYYANQGRRTAEIVSPLYAASAYLALVLKQPHVAVKLRSRFMRDKAKYDAVFDRQMDLRVWSVIVRLCKGVDEGLEGLRAQVAAERPTERFLKSWRYMIAFILLARQLGTFAYNSADLVEIEPDVGSSLVADVWEKLASHATERDWRIRWTAAGDVKAACKLLAPIYGIADVDALEFSRRVAPYGSRSVSKLDEKFVASVRAILPAQPWKPGMHQDAARRLGCGAALFSAAVTRLIKDGIFYDQRDGVLYDHQGEVVGFDPDRVDPATMRLRRKLD